MTIENALGSDSLEMMLLKLEKVDRHEQGEELLAVFADKCVESAQGIRPTGNMDENGNQGDGLFALRALAANPGPAFGVDVTDTTPLPRPTATTAFAPAVGFSVPPVVQPAPAPLDDLSMPTGYVMLSDGIHLIPGGADAPSIFVCSPLMVHSRFADTEGRGWGKLVGVRAGDGRWHKLPVGNAELQATPGKVIATLVDHGLILSGDRKSGARVVELLAAWEPEQFQQCVRRLGWVDDQHDVFAADQTVIGSRSILPLLPAESSGVSICGNLRDWRNEIGALCEGNPLMLLAVSLAFSGPLLAPLNMSGGGLHFRGASSSGKTTLLNLAASVWGGRIMITQWRSTTNGLEAIAAGLNDMLLPLDEIAEISGRELHEAIYMLANGTGKARMTAEVARGNQARWRLPLISSGEISVQEKLVEAKLGAMAGHEVRLIDVEADMQAFGAFDNLHGAACPAQFADEIRKRTGQYHGSAGPAFVQGLIDGNLVDDPSELRRLIDEKAQEWITELPGAPDGQIARVAKRLATIGVAGSLATEFGLTGWHVEAAFDAAKQAFLDWYDNRYGTKREAADRYVELLKQFLTTKLASIPLVSDATLGSTSQIGWRDHNRVYLLPDTWRTIFSEDGMSQASAALLDIEMLLPGEGGRLLRKAPRQIPGRPRLYTVNIEKVMAYDSV